MYISNIKQENVCGSLWQALGFSVFTEKPFCIAAVGSGGKTSLLYALAREGRSRGLSVLLLPTTHMHSPGEDGVLTGRAEDVIQKLRADGFAVAGIPTAKDPRKIGFPGWETYERVKAEADLVLVEADGSRRLPLKYPNETEPVLPSSVQVILSVTGMSSLGQAPEEVCHRFPLAREALSSKTDWTQVSLKDLMTLQQKGYLLPLRRKFPDARVIPVWNQADTPDLRTAAREALSRMGELDALVTSFCSCGGQ